MPPTPYDTNALARFVENTDLFGLKRLPAPPDSVLKADQMRREPHAGLQWVAGITTFILSAVLSAIVVMVFRIAVTGETDVNKLQNFAQSLGLSSESDPVALIILLAGQAIFATLLYWVFVRVIANRPVYELGGEGWFKEFAAGLLLGTVLIGVIIGTLYGMGHYKVEGIQPSMGVIVGLFIGISPGFAEEVVFRGFFLRLLDKSLGAWPALIITSVVFGLVHASNPYVTLIQSLWLGVSAGLLLGAAYFLTRRLWLAIGLHLSWNFVQGGIFNSDVSGNGYNTGLLKATFDGPEWLTGGKMGIEGSYISIGLTIVVGLIMLAMAHRRGNLTGRVGWNAPRINLTGSVPRIEIWAGDGGWRPLPTPVELNAIMADDEVDDADLAALTTEGHAAGLSTTTPETPPPTTTGDLAQDQPVDTPAQGESEAIALGAPEATAISEEDQAIDSLPIPPEDELLTGDLPTIEAAHGVMPDDPTQQFEPINAETMADGTAWPSDAELEAMKTKSGGEGPPTITKVSSSVTAVTGTGREVLSDDDLDATAQIDAIAELDMTDQIKPVEQTKIDPSQDQ